MWQAENTELLRTCGNAQMWVWDCVRVHVREVVLPSALLLPASTNKQRQERVIQVHTTPQHHPTAQRRLHVHALAPFIYK